MRTQEEIYADIEAATVHTEELKKQVKYCETGLRRLKDEFWEAFDLQCEKFNIVNDVDGCHFNTELD